MTNHIKNIVMPNQVIRTKSAYKPWKEMPDAEIWDSFKSGNSEALEYIYRTYAKDLFNFGMKIKANSSLVEDAIQELFVELWSSRRNLANTQKIRFYLLKALKRKIYYHLNRERKLYAEKSAEEISAVQVTLPFESRLIDEQSINERKAYLLHCVSQLPQRQKEVLQLLFFEDLSYEEVAEIMNIRVKSVYILACRTLSSLRKEMKQRSTQFFVHWSIFLYAFIKLYQWLTSIAA